VGRPPEPPRHPECPRWSIAPPGWPSWTNGRGVEVMDQTYGLLDLTVYGRQERWEDSPAGWPQRSNLDDDVMRSNGRPIAQWPRLAAGLCDDLSGAGRR